MTSETDICNRALQLLGAKRITSRTQESVNARACDECFDNLRDAELRDHRWSFAIARAGIAEDATPPDWGRGHSYTLPSDFLKLIPLYPEDEFVDKDWVIEGKKIITDDTAPLYIRYIKRVTAVADMDSLFCEALSARIAMAICQEITQSTSALQNIAAEYDRSVKRARKANAIEVVPATTPADEWIERRS